MNHFDRLCALNHSSHYSGLYSGRYGHAQHVARRGYRYRRIDHALHPALPAHALLGNHALLRSAGRGAANKFP